MWLVKFHILLLTIKLVHSNKETSFPIDELYHQLSSIPSLVNDLHLESELVNGNVTPMALISKLLGRKLDEEMFEEYSQMDISSGIKEQNDLLELVDKAEEVKTNEDVRKDVGDRLEGLNSVNDTIPIVEKLLAEVTEALKTTEERSKLNMSAAIEHYRSGIHRDWNDMQSELVSVEQDFKRISDFKPEDLRREPRFVEFTLVKLRHPFRQIFDHFDIDSRTITSFYFLDQLKNTITEVGKHLEEMKKFDGLNEKISLVENEMKVLDDLRDSGTVKNLQEFLKKLEDVTVGEIEILEDVQKKYKNIESSKSLIQHLMVFTNYMRNVEWRLPDLKKRWIPVTDHLKNIQIPPGNWTATFSSILTCLHQYDFSMDAGNEKSVLQKFDDSLNETRSMIENFETWAHSLQMEVVKIERRVMDLVMRSMKINNWSDRDFKIFVEEAKSIEISRLGVIVNDILKPIKGRPGNPSEELSMLESKLYEIDNTVKKLGFNELKAMGDSVKKKTSKLEQFLKCYSDLKVVPSDVKILMDKPKEVWNFDAIPLEKAVEVVSLFKGAHKMIGELANWKFDDNPLFKEFPLDSEDVKGINEGFGALEAIRNVRNGWIHIDGSEIEKSDVKDDWNILISSLETFSEELSHLKFRTKLPDFQKFISNVQFPNNIQIDPLINFYSTQYKGKRKNEILKYVEYVKQFQMDYPGYSSKLEKMNEAIGKMNKWLEDQKVVTDEKEEPYVDCAVSYCDRVFTFPAAT